MMVNNIPFVTLSPDLQGIPLTNPDLILLVGGSDGKDRKGNYQAALAVASCEQPESGHLPQVKSTPGTAPCPPRSRPLIRGMN